MKKLIALAFAFLIMLVACNHSKDNAATNQAKIYYDYLTSKGEIETEATPEVGGGIQKYNVNDLYYFFGDFNYDGIDDLAISTEASDSNGIEIYTYKDGKVTSLLSNHMPFSAGTEIFTLATCDGKYGIKYFRKNSFGDFEFNELNKDGTLKLCFEGISYDLEGNALKDAASYDKIKPVNFYKIDGLKKMY